MFPQQVLGGRMAQTCAGGSGKGAEGRVQGGSEMGTGRALLEEGQVRLLPALQAQLQPPLPPHLCLSHLGSFPDTYCVLSSLLGPGWEGSVCLYAAHVLIMERQ